MHIDREVSHAYWRARSARASDPRSVTLDRSPRLLIALQLLLYQRWLFRRLPRGHSPAVAVDLGCGNGDWTVPLARRAERVIAVDFSREFLAHTRARLEREPDAAPVELVEADLAQFEPPPCDLLVAGAVFQYLADDEVRAVLAQSARALEGGGFLYLRTTVSRAGRAMDGRSDFYQAIYRTPEWYGEELARAGFAVRHSDRAPDLAAEELVRGVVGETLWPRLGEHVAAPFRAATRAYRRRRTAEVYSILAQPAPAPR